MDLNAYAIVDGFVALLRCVFALAVMGLGIVSLRAGWGRESAAQELREDRSYLLVSLTTLLVGLNVISWPLLYVFLQSLVPRLPGAMCIYGVTQIGAGTDGISRFLPGMVQMLQILKPAQVFLGGAWLVLYRINRQTLRGSLWRRVFIVQIFVGLLALTDGILEASYLAIPKREEFRTSGCCTAAINRGSSAGREMSVSIGSPEYSREMTAIYYGVQFAVVGGICSIRRASDRRRLTGLLVLTLGSIPITVLFLVEVAAPAVLRLPYHRCLYDLIPRAPDMLLGIVCHAAGVFAVGWAFVAGCLGRTAETAKVAAGEERRWLTVARDVLIAALLVVTTELVLV